MDLKYRDQRMPLLYALVAPQEHAHILCLLHGASILLKATNAVTYTCYYCTWLLHACSSEVVKSSKMAELMRDNTALAQELLANVMDHPAKKAKIA